MEDKIMEYIMYNEEELYNKMCELYPERVNSDTLLEDFEDEVYEYVKELLED